MGNELDYATELEKCTRLLSKHYPEATSCNGLLQVSGHLENILLRTPDTELVEALEDLYSWQNGPPLLTQENQWQAAMDKAEELLIKYGSIIPNKESTND